MVLMLVFYCLPVLMLAFVNMQPRGGHSSDGFTPGYRITGVTYGWPVPAIAICHTRWRDLRTGIILKRSDQVVAWQRWPLVADGLVVLCATAISYLAWRDRQRKQLPFPQWSLATMIHGLTTLSVAIAVASMPFEERWMILHWKPFWAVTWWQSRALVSVAVAILVWWVPASLAAFAAWAKSLQPTVGGS